MQCVLPRCVLPPQALQLQSRDMAALQGSMTEHLVAQVGADEYRLRANAPKLSDSMPDSDSECFSLVARMCASQVSILQQAFVTMADGVMGELGACVCFLLCCIRLHRTHFISAPPPLDRPTPLQLSIYVVHMQRRCAERRPGGKRIDKSG